jgi:hypothetical protein
MAVVIYGDGFHIKMSGTLLGLRRADWRCLKVFMEAN